MPINYTVVQGDHLSRIAKKFGFSDYRTIWNQPQNADLQKLRQNPSVLYPGDIVFIPDRTLREESKPTDQRHLFVVHRPNLKLRLIVEDQYEAPVANADCILAVGSDSGTTTTDGDGKIEKLIPSDTTGGSLTIMDPQTPFESIQIPLNVGYLDPVEEFSGQWGRLANLGYITGDITDQRPDDFRSAVEEFQCDQNLAVDGDCGPATQAKLKQVHGC